MTVAVGWMALGRQRDRQSEMLVTWAEMPRPPGHVFYDRLQAELVAAGFDGFVEDRCAPYYAAGRGRPSLPPGRYFRMLLSATSRGSTASAVWSGAALIACPCGSSCGSASAIRCLTIPGCRAPGAACHSRCMMPCLPGCCSA